LAPICSSLAVLPLVRDNPSEVTRIGEIVERQVQHMVRIVDDLLDVARITRGKLHLRQEHCDLRRVADDAVSMVRTLVDERRLRLTVTMPAEAIAVRGDVTRLTQAIGNLLHNAAKFTPPGGTISLTLAQDGPHAFVHVRDNGEGIPAAMLSEIFEVFRQVDQSASRAHGGVGIGLTLAREIANLHGGRLEAHSEGLGRGSEFCLVLPVTEQVSLGVPEPHLGPALAVEPGVPRRVLIVDDIAAAGESLAELLELRGHDVRLADSGLAAIEAMLADPPDVALIDLGMPGMDGYEVARRLRSVPQLDHVALVALTGYGGPEIRQRVSEVGFDGHITKPAPLAELEKLLDALPAGRRTRTPTSPMLR
jgi:CheY-like chemotaxis protein